MIIFTFKLQSKSYLLKWFWCILDNHMSTYLQAQLVGEELIFAELFRKYQFYHPMSCCYSCVSLADLFFCRQFEYCVTVWYNYI